METFSDWIEAKLFERDWRPADLARRANIGDATLSRILNQSRQAGPDVCRAIARALKVDEEEIFRRAGLLSPIPPAVAEEREAARILRGLMPEYRAVALNILRAFKSKPALQPRIVGVAEEPAAYQLPGSDGAPDPYVETLSQTWDQAPDWLKAAFVAQLQAAVAELNQPISLDQEITEFLEDYPDLQDIIAEAQSNLSEQAIRALLINIRTFAALNNDREAFTHLHQQLSDLFARHAS